MRRFTILRAFIHTRRLVRKAARRAAVACSVVMGTAWWAVSTVATSGLALAVGTAAFVLSAIVGAVCFFVSGE